MLFNSLEFILFFPAVTLGFFLLPKKVKPVWLLLASYFFYMCWNPYYIVLILLTTFVTFLSGILIDKSKGQSSKRLIMVLCIVFNIGILVLFKYFDFILLNLNKVFGVFGVRAVSNPFNFLLPVGISFYTFQAIGYVIDVYRKDVKAERNFIDYALFVSFFPQLVAGPIERSRNLLCQIKDIRKKNLFDHQNAVSGFGLMLWGLFLKMVIADRAAIFVDKVFTEYYAFGSVELIFGAVLFSLQIYADFAGYSSVAIGAARVMGIRLMDNFDTPYFSKSIAEFWRRWHISLSFWFRDYLYIPLGGNRKGTLRKYLNLFITFMVSGLWHGASWNYVAWGAVHGIYQIVGGMTKPIRERCYDRLNVKRNTFSFDFLKRIITFLLVAFAWIFFRARSLKASLIYISRMFTCFDPWVLFNEGIYGVALSRKEFNILIVSVIVLFAVSVIKYRKKIDIGTFLYEENLWFRWAALIGLILSIVVFGEYGIDFSSAKFIYFDF